MTKRETLKILTPYSLEIMSRALHSYSSNIANPDVAEYVGALAEYCERADSGKLTRRIATEEH